MQKKILLLIVFLLPISLSAQTLQDFIVEFKELLVLLLPVVIGVALLFFLWGLASFILHASDDTAREEAKKKILWGLISLFIIVSIWGLVAILQTALFDSSPTYNLPLNPNP